ncbi:extracellular solute-binding protein [Marinomonas primoryensis]|jgi:multiple sugar transport system substrate-binding protein|uniref:Extracellular solute-binding protein n=1 Tax=Marinomonas primoryensis TaxID=178399 RepID=A0A859CUY2_9GAMM|nr:extracellular solute-binding protein [Marinomonas primoryensis]QKK80207.1 maltose ABC transporter periplasmic protein [Marinomonas primoryensis]|tara:strand:+ start:4560 stop:5870 length:1311 start_codon:yes stop_codon:yes gene_type:complete
MNKLLIGTTTVSMLMLSSWATANTTIELQRFFGACEAEYGKATDVSAAVGECGIITTLVNKFDADNPDIDVKVTTVEWPGYDQLNAQLASRSAPDVVSMHYSAMSDYQSRGLLVPLDALLKDQKIKATDFTDAAISSVTKEGKIYALPFDNWTMLFHVNNNLMEKAGLMKADGKPILPTSRDELFTQGKQFYDATGKPYLVQILANETATYARIFYTLMMQQDSPFFADPSHIDLSGKDAKTALSFMKDIMDKGLSTTDMDYPAAVSGFANGDGGIAVNGTWLIGSYYDQSTKADNALSNGYSVFPVPQFFKQKDATYADGHGWVVPRGNRSDEKMAAIGKLFKFLYDNDFEWSRTGHLPTVKKVIASNEFKSLPHRSDIAKIAKTGQALPAGVLRQFAIQDILGEELGSAVNGDKSIDDALETAQYRINDLLENI